MLPFASGVNRYFRFRENSFRWRFRKPFPLVARSVYAPPRSASQPLICILAKFAATQSVDPVTREKHSKQTHLPCQHKNHFCTDIQEKPRPEPISWELPSLPQPTHHTFNLAFSTQLLHTSPLSVPFSHDAGYLLPDRREDTPKSAQASHAFPVIYIDVQTITSSLGEICLTSITPLLIFRHTTK